MMLANILDGLVKSILVGVFFGLAVGCILAFVMTRKMKNCDIDVFTTEDEFDNEN